MASSTKVNFVHQQGFRDASPSACAPQFSALLFQPRIVGPVILVGLWLQAWWLFAALAVLLWWNTLVPRLNPFDALYNALLAGSGGRMELPPAPPPRRFAQGMAAAFATIIAAALAAGWHAVAWTAEALLVAAFAALLFGKFCLGSYIYYHLKGEGEFARRTAPWAAGG